MTLQNIIKEGEIKFRKAYKEAYTGILLDEVLEKGNPWFEYFLFSRTTKAYRAGVERAIEIMESHKLIEAAFDPTTLTWKQRMNSKIDEISSALSQELMDKTIDRLVVQDDTRLKKNDPTAQHVESVSFKETSSKECGDVAKDFEKGKQPCKEFKGEVDQYGLCVHSCYCGSKTEKPCKKTVSFCLNCNTDHHEDGYENCVCEGKGFIEK